MAGIGFTLRRMLGEKGLLGPVRAFSYAAVVSAGLVVAAPVTGRCGTGSALIARPRVPAGRCRR